MSKYFFRYRNQLFFSLLGFLFFVPFLGKVHLFDWDEVNFAEAAREMLELQNYLKVHINYHLFWEKPPFFIWLQALSMHIFGVGEYAARFPNAICGMITLVILYQIGTKLYNPKFGFIWAGTYFGSILPHFYFKSGIIDPYFNLFMFLALYFLILLHWKRNLFPNITLSKSNTYYLVLAGFFCGLAVLTKGPVGYLIVAITLGVYWIFQKFNWFLSILQLFIFSVLSFTLFAFWIGAATVQEGLWFLQEFVLYQYRLFSTPDGGHGGFAGYHFVVLLVGCFPASLFFIRSFWLQPEQNAYQTDFVLFMKILFWVVLILFSIVKSKIVHYSSMAYFPLTYLASLVLYQIHSELLDFSKKWKIALFALAFLIALVPLALPIVGMNIDQIKPLIQNDPFALANFGAEVSWEMSDLGVGIFYFSLIFIVIVLFYQRKTTWALVSIFGGTAVLVWLILALFINRIEAYTQRANIEFFENLAKKDVYVGIVGYKSYAPWFYARSKPDTKLPIQDWGKWGMYLIENDMDKDVYVSTKIGNSEGLENRKEVEKIGEKNGFVFWLKRKK